MGEVLERLRRFQKCLRTATAASTSGEAEAAEAAARRLMALYDINPLVLSDNSLYDRGSFADNALLLKLREEYRMAHPPKQKRKRQKKGSPASSVRSEDIEPIRLLYNDGFETPEIALKFGYSYKAVNNLKDRYLRRIHRWFLDSDGKIQWVKTAGQPGRERAQSASNGSAVGGSRPPEQMKEAAE